jgi:aldehyde dehydrogenase (NAD+)
MSLQALLAETPPALPQIFDHYVNGHSLRPDTGSYFSAVNPFSGEEWGQIARGNKIDADRAVASAKHVFPKWSTFTGTERGGYLFRLAALVDKHYEALARAQVRENGKTISEMRTQMKNTALWYRYYAGLADKLEGRVLPFDRANHLDYVVLSPLGVIVAIIPWNSPLRLLSWKIAPALAAGNTVVIKPSEFTSASTLLFMELIEEAGFPPGVVNVVTGLGPEVGQALAQNRDVARIAFTGGEAGGVAVYEAAARTLKPITLELGGKSPQIVFEDADLDKAVLGCAAGCFASTGQTCLAGSRLLVHENVHDTLVERVVKHARSMTLGDPMSPNTQIGPVATRQQFEKILRYVDIARREGATIATGGRHLKRADLSNGLFVEPTVLTGVTNRMRVAQEEIFGPVLSVIRFSTEAEAIEIANDSPFGLAAGIWTRDLSRAHRVAGQLQAGSIWVNTYRVTSFTAPFGGFKRSGFGREGGMEMIKQFVQEKNICIELETSG